MASNALGSMLNLFTRASPRRPTPDTRPPSTDTRQKTIKAAFEEQRRRQAMKEASTPPSLVTGSTITDRSSEVDDENNATPGPLGPSFQPLDGSLVSKEENFTPTPVQSLSQGMPLLQPSTDDHSSAPNDEQPQLLRQSLDILDTEWKLGTMPGHDVEVSTKTTADTVGPVANNSITGQVSRAAKTLKNKLKRPRATSDVDGDNAEQPMTPTRKSNRKLKASPKASKQAIPIKIKREVRAFKPRVKPATPAVSSSSKPTVKRNKIWLEEGLYVGQERHFNPRLTERKNKAKRQSMAEEGELKKENRVLPRPMFAGERLLEKGREFDLPWDVYSPLPARQPRPEDYRKTSKNVFIGEAKSLWNKVKGKELSVCPCRPESGCAYQCQNRIMWYECNDSNCCVGRDKCTNRQFAQLQERLAEGRTASAKKFGVGVEPFKTQDRGFGLRANRSFEPGQIIVEYTGEIITKQEANNRTHTKKDDECHYLMDFHQGMLLDATRGSIARFVNHSCSPNCYIEKWTVQGVPRMALFAGDNGIMTGEEVTYDYRFDPYNRANVQECRCGAANCRRVLGPKLSAPKEPKDALKPIAGQKRKLDGVVDSIQEKSKSLIEGVKRRKLNVAKGIKGALNSASGSTSASKANKDTSTGKKPTAKSKPALPKGWIYPKEAQPFRSINGDDQDPEAILRAQKRHAKADETEVSSSSRARTKKGTPSTEKDAEDRKNATPKAANRRKTITDNASSPKMTISTRSSPRKPDIKA